jgi:endonuclease-8
VPEGDTVWLTAQRLDRALRGRVLTVFELRVPALATADLRGTAVSEVLACGKHILIRFDGALTLHNHLRMDGSWQLAATGQRHRGRPEHLIRAVLGNQAWTAAGYRVHDLRLVRTSEEDQLVGHLGPDLLGPDWDATEAARRLAAHPLRPIGESLLDQRLLAGIGNLYKAEVLFIERVNPWMPTAEVSNLAAIVSTAHRLLRMNRDHPEQSTTGSTRRGSEHWVYLRTGQPCLRCGTAIASAEQGEPPRQRRTFWCPSCQPGHGPGAGAGAGADPGAGS